MERGDEEKGKMEEELEEKEESVRKNKRNKGGGK